MLLDKRVCQANAQNPRKDHPRTRYNLSVPNSRILLPLLLSQSLLSRAKRAVLYFEAHPLALSHRVGWVVNSGPSLDLPAKTVACLPLPGRE